MQSPRGPTGVEPPRRAHDRGDAIRRVDGYRSLAYRSWARSALKHTATVSPTFIEPISIPYGLMPNSD